MHVSIMILVFDGTIDLFDLQVVILEVIFYQWSTHTVIGTEIGVNSHGKSIHNISMSLTQLSTALLSDLFDLHHIYFLSIRKKCEVSDE